MTRSPASRSGWKTTYPETNRGYGVRVIPIRDSYVGAGDRRLGIVLMSAVGFVLLIMCANLANLMLVRGAARQRELAVRAAMGAGRGRLLWVTLSETVLVAVPGAAIGMLMSQWLVDAMIGAFPAGSLPYWLDFTRRRTRRVVCHRRRDLHDAGGGRAAGVAHGAPESRQRLEGRRPWRFARARQASVCRPASSSRRWRSVSRCWLAPT